MMNRGSVAGVGLLAGLSVMPAPAENGYRTPPEAVVRAIDAMDTKTPAATASPDGRWVLLQHPQSRPSIEELAKPTLGLAGWLVDPATQRAMPGDFRPIK